MNKRLRLAVALPLCCGAMTAQAGSLSEPELTPAPAPVQLAPAPVVPSSDWSGFYAGGNIGYGQLTSEAFDESPEGMTYGLHAGYLADLGAWVVGAELEYDVTDIADETSDIALDSVARAKVRAGYDAGLFLPYVTIGAAQAATSGGLVADDTGAFAGLGVDYKLTDSLRIGAEVLQHQFEDFGGSGSDIDATTASLRVGFRF